MSAIRFNTQNRRGQRLLFRCLETGFVTTGPALTRDQRGRGIDPGQREHYGQTIRGNQQTGKSRRLTTAGQPMHTADFKIHLSEDDWAPELTETT